MHQQPPDPSKQQTNAASAAASNAASASAAKSPAAATNAAKPATSSESKIRLTAFIVLVLIVAYLISGFGIFLLILLADFSLRAFGFPQYSPLAFIAGQLATAFKMSDKPVFMPPKRFAARVGFVFCLAITILHYGEFEISATAIGFLLGAFAALESLAGFCAGCYVYNYWARLRSR